MIVRHPYAAAAGLAALAALASPAAADDMAKFYAGRTVSAVVASAADGLAGLYGRVVAEHIGRNIPGAPTVVPMFMPGSGGTKGANYCYNVAAKDGSAICQLSQMVPMIQLLRPTGVKYDAAKFGWLGQSADQNGAISVYRTVAAKTLQDAMKEQIVLGATGRGSETFIDPTMVNAALGTKFKLVLGYTGGGDLDLALERGEIQGKAGALLSILVRQRQWLDDGRLRILAQVGLRKHPDLPDVPLLTDLAPDEESRQIMTFVSARAQVGRAFVTPPGAPADRVVVLRKAFAATMKDPVFLAAAKKQQMEINPSSGAEVEAVVQSILSTPKPVVDKTRALLGLDKTGG